MIVPEYLIDIDQEMNANADPGAASKMKQYMKGQFAFYGISSPLRKELLKKHIRKNGLIPEAEKTKLVHWCWKADEREWQYICMELLGRRAKKAEVSHMMLYEFMITTKSWWDTVDYIASNLVGPYFRLFPDQVHPVTERWMASRNLWLQRTCLLFQLKYRADTDTALLSKFIQQLKSSGEFFIRK
ncbi:MAG: DNA alkylation repair protein, partial [bacterium]